VIFQKVNEKYSEAMNLTENGELNAEAMKKIIDERVKDQEFNSVLKKAFDDCVLFIPKKMETIEKEWSAPPMNINKNDCNIKLSAMIGCMNMNSILVNEFSDLQLRAKV
jgi:hypothetical protein